MFDRKLKPEGRKLLKNVENNSRNINVKDKLRTTEPFVTEHLEIFHCTHHPVIPKSDLYFTFCSTLIRA